MISAPAFFEEGNRHSRRLFETIRHSRGGKQGIQRAGSGKCSLEFRADWRFKRFRPDLTLKPMKVKPDGKCVVVKGGTTATIRRIPRGYSLACVRGRLWVTSSGDREDYILGEGESLSPIKRRKVLIYALLPSQVRLVLTAPGERAAQPGASQSPPRSGFPTHGGREEGCARASDP